MMSELAYVLSHGDEAVTDAVVRTLERDGWTVVQSSADPYQAVNGVVYIPGLWRTTPVRMSIPRRRCWTSWSRCGRGFRRRRMAAPGWRRSAVAPGLAGRAAHVRLPRRPHWWRWCEALRSRTARPASRSTV